MSRVDVFFFGLKRLRSIHVCRYSSLCVGITITIRFDVHFFQLLNLLRSWVKLDFMHFLQERFSRTRSDPNSYISSYHLFITTRPVDFKAMIIDSQWAVKRNFRVAVVTSFKILIITLHARARECTCVYVVYYVNDPLNGIPRPVNKTYVYQKGEESLHVRDL